MADTFLDAATGPAPYLYGTLANLCTLTRPSAVLHLQCTLQDCPHGSASFVGT